MADTLAPTVQAAVERLAYSPTEAAKRAGLGRSTIYEAVAAGRLPARKLGARTLILHADLVRFLEALPAYEVAS